MLELKLRKLLAESLEFTNAPSRTTALTMPVAEVGRNRTKSRTRGHNGLRVAKSLEAVRGERVSAWHPLASALHCPFREVLASRMLIEATFTPDRGAFRPYRTSASGFVRPTLAISCGLGWRDACGSTRRDDSDRQLNRHVSQLLAHDDT